MTNYYVKLTQEASEKLIATIGINALEINMAKGLIKVATLDDVRNVAEKYAVDNVNHQPYDKVMSEKPTTSDFKPVKEFSLKERKEIIGKTIDIGSIVMLDLEEGIEHAVIIAVKDDKYVAARMLLKKTNKETPDSIPIRKGIDVIYRNPTYKDIVTVVNEVAYSLEASDFKKDSGGAILGRVVNQEILDKIVQWNKKSEEEEYETIDPVSFEQIVKTCKDVEAIIKNLWLSEYYLENLVRECASNKTRNMKVLLPAMKKNHLGNRTLAQIKEDLEFQLEGWSKTMLVDMKECTLQYCLKVIQEQISK